MARLTIGLPVHDGERFLEEAIASLQAQTFTDFQLIICDNASTDETFAICTRAAAADPRISVYRNEKNLGAAANFNRAFELGDSELFKWAACDDLYEPTYLQRCIDVLDRRPELVGCYSEAREIDESGATTADYEHALRLDSANVGDRFRDMIVVRHACVAVFGVMRRSVLARTPLIGAYVSSDRVLLAELALFGPMFEVPERLFLRRKHAKNSIWLDKRGDLLAWFDTSQCGVINLPYWRALREIVAALRRSGPRSSVRLRCWWAVLDHIRLRRRELKNDLINAGRRWAARSRVLAGFARAVNGISRHQS